MLIKKKAKSSAESARLLYLGSIAVLVLNGFLMEWQVKEFPFWYAGLTVLIPALPAAVIYALECQTHPLYLSPLILKNKHYFHTALPLMLICWGMILEEHFLSLNLYWSAGYLICSYTTYITLSNAPGIRCSQFLAQTALFGYMSIYQDNYAGSSIAIALMSVFLLFRFAQQEQEDPLSFPVCAMALIAMLLCAVVPVFERLLYSAISQEDAFVLDSFRNLLPHVRIFGKTELRFTEYEGLLSGHQLGFLLARLGWIAAVPAALAMIGLVIGGFWLTSNERTVSILTFGCQMLLVLRLVSSLLYLPGLYMGLCSDVPFLGGDALQRIVDYLLCAMVLLPMAQTELEELDPQDPDFEIRERRALEALHHNRTGLTRLCRYVFNNPHALQGWVYLFENFTDLMDANTLNIMARNADAVLPQERFRVNFRNTVPLDDGAEIHILPREGSTQFTSNEYLDEESNFRTNGVFLSRYLGSAEKLLIPPFWLAIGESALAENPYLQAVSLPNTILRVCENAFRDCNALTTVELRKGLIALDDHAFCCTGLTQLQLPPGLETLGRGCFRSTFLTSVRIPGTVQEIPENCFADNPHLDTVILEEGMTKSIGPGAFRNCSALRHIRIPANIQEIHPTAFEGCTALVSVDAEDDWLQQHSDILLHMMFPEREKEEV